MYGTTAEPPVARRGPASAMSLLISSSICFLALARMR